MSRKRIFLMVLVVFTMGILTAQVKYPYTFRDSYDREVTLPSEPKRVVSLGPNVTETVFVLGKGGTLVGRTDYCDYPAEAMQATPVGSITDPVVEKIIALDPDLVIGSTHVKKEIVTQLELAGVPVAIFWGPESFKGVYELVLNVGKTLNAEAAARRHVTEMQSTVALVTEKTAGLKKPSLYYVVGYGEWGDYTAGKGTFISELIAMAGGRNVADDTEGWKYSLERLVEHDPDMLICSQYWGAKEGLIVANGYKDLSAVENDRVYAIDNNMLDRQGPRLAEGLYTLAALLHPDIFK